LAIYGRTVAQPRLVAYMADAGTPPYTYSGLQLQPSPWAQVCVCSLQDATELHVVKLCAATAAAAVVSQAGSERVGLSCCRVWLQVVLDVRAAVQQLLPGTHFNSCLLNLYRDGSHHVSWHSDNERL
jgi:hypothetical protein